MSQEQALLDTIIAATRSGKLVLPSLPGVVTRVRTAVNDPMTSSLDVARLVQLDPALTARLVQVANSPLYSHIGKASNLSSAVTRLGLQVTRNLVTSFALNGLFKTGSRRLQVFAQRAWEQSCKVSAISYVLARLIPNIDPERAMLAGLIYDIGILPLLGYAERFPELAEDTGKLQALMIKLRGPLGSFILKNWEFEDDLAAIPRQIESWTRDSGEAIDYGDVVMVARIHSLYGTPRAKQLPALDSLPAFRKLDFHDLGPAASLELIKESRNEISAVLQMLRG